jgi:hypothetical protein
MEGMYVRKMKLGGGFLAAPLAIAVLARLHPAENKCGEPIRAGITTNRTPQDQPPQQALSQTAACRLVYVAFVTTGTTGHNLGPHKERQYFDASTAGIVTQHLLTNCIVGRDSSSYDADSK